MIRPGDQFDHRGIQGHGKVSNTRANTAAVDSAMAAWDIGSDLRVRSSDRRSRIVSGFDPSAAAALKDPSVRERREVNLLSRMAGRSADVSLIDYTPVIAKRAAPEGDAPTDPVLRAVASVAAADLVRPAWPMREKPLPSCDVPSPSARARPTPAARGQGGDDADAEEPESPDYLTLLCACTGTDADLRTDTYRSKRERALV